MWIVKRVGELGAGYVVSWFIVYLAIAMPYATPFEVWQTRGNPHSGALVFLFAVPVWLVCMSLWYMLRLGRNRKNKE